MTDVEVSVRRAGARVALDRGAPLDVGLDGLTLALSIPAHVTVEDATLELHEPDASARVTISSERVDIETSAGSGLPSQAVQWVAADWRSRRALVSIRVDAGDASLRARLKLSDGGPWYAPGVELLPLNDVVQLPALKARRLLVEFVRPGEDEPTPATVAVNNLTLEAQARPLDLELSLDESAAFARRDPALAAGAPWIVRERLLAALRDARAEPGPTRLLLRSSSPGHLKRVQFTLDISERVRTWPNGQAEQQLTLAPDRTTRMPLPALSGVPSSLAFSLRSEFNSERVITTARPSAAAIAHRGGPGSFAAQRLPRSPTGARVVAVELYLRPLSARVKASVRLHLDRDGQPDEHSLPEGSLELVIEHEDARPWPAAWRGVELPDALAEALAGHAAWVVLAVDEGDLLWSLDPIELDDRETPRALHRVVEEPTWRERRLPVDKREASASARARLRVTAALPPQPTLTLTRGSRRVSLSMDEEDAVRVSLTELQFSAASSEPFVLELRAPLAGAVTLADLDLRSKPTTRTFEFPGT